MVKVFLDTNYFIDAIHRKPEANILEKLEDYIPVISTLSFHIYCYLFKIKVPNKRLRLQKLSFGFIEFSEEILEKALQGPTADFEDNIQLHSAIEAEADYFITSDKKLLKMGFFGKAKIIEDLN